MASGCKVIIRGLNNIIIRLEVFQLQVQISFMHAILYLANRFSEAVPGRAYKRICIFQLGHK